MVQGLGQTDYLVNRVLTTNATWEKNCTEIKKLLLIEQWGCGSIGQIG